MLVRVYVLTLHLLEASFGGGVKDEFDDVLGGIDTDEPS